MKKKSVFILLTVLILNLFSISGIAMTRSEFDAKLESLKQTYYQGKQQSEYEEGWTCFGYAYMIAKNVFGTSAKTWAISYDLNGVKAGDVVQYGNTTGSGHTIFVTNVSGDTITYTDCNSDYESTIKWNQIVSKSSNKIWSYAFSYRRVAPDLESDIPKDTEKPQISDVTFIRTPDGYIASCKAIDNTGVSKVLFPTWTAKNGQDDLDENWAADNSSVKGIKNGNYYTFSVKMSEHNNEEGIYYTHIYAYDLYGNESSTDITINVYKDNEPPVIKNVRIFEKDARGYTIKCDVTDNKKLIRVQFPTWTAYNAQDDLDGDWETSAKYSGTLQDNTYTYRVNISDHNNESGIYKTHIYAYDECGNFTKANQLVLINNNGYSPVLEIQGGNKKYMFFDNPYNLNWGEAKQYCELIGGHLAVITSDDENRLLANETVRLDKDYYFIGATDAASEGVWKWINGEKWSYTNWESGEPNNLNDEDYLALTKQGHWNDLSYDHETGFICEFESTEPYIKSKITKKSNLHIIDTELGNISNGTLIIAGYKNGRLVTVKSEECSTELKSVTLIGDLDMIKVMVWNEKMMPVTANEEIPSSEWIIQ